LLPAQPAQLLLTLMLLFPMCPPSVLPAGSRYLLFGSDEASMHQQFVDFFSEDDWQAHKALQVRRVVSSGCCVCWGCMLCRLLRW
jgi:hypothetical protein